MSPSESPHNQSKGGQPAAEPHQHQASSTTHRSEDEWKHNAPYRIHHESKEGFEVKWRGECHCGRIKYELSRDRPLASKYCHCTTCQRLHGAPFQWAAIFHKEDINFTQGIHDIGWYDPSQKSQTHHLPCKVQCGFCRTPIMDEGRNMILLFPTLIEGISTPKARKAFEAKCHMFYGQRVVDFKGDGATKFAGLEDDSDIMDDDGNVIQKKEDKEKEDKEKEKEESESEKNGKKRKKEN
ncbi:hypothetical protein VMCG_05876 [Cytospora schulzeri]|uniref:CENP-V/GFA domain-containing protein n=1 Tax=Cytospora schulzeri TaxID=448051 RepID=A0A423WD17_9PEZI|nr:hypothetical protein VMCG_05876 [Valsa malicola]